MRIFYKVWFMPISPFDVTVLFKAYRKIYNKQAEHNELKYEKKVILEGQSTVCMPRRLKSTFFFKVRVEGV